MIRAGYRPGGPNNHRQEGQGQCCANQASDRPSSAKRRYHRLIVDIIGGLNSHVHRSCIYVHLSRWMNRQLWTSGSIVAWHYARIASYNNAPFPAV